MQVHCGCARGARLNETLVCQTQEASFRPPCGHWLGAPPSWPKGRIFIGIMSNKTLPKTSTLSEWLKGRIFHGYGRTKHRPKHPPLNKMTEPNTEQHILAEPPCREADRARAECPECQRSVQLRWLRYGHVCGRTWNAQQRAIEEIPRAGRQFRERTEPPAPTPTTTATPRATTRATKDWSHMLAGML